MKFSAQKFIAVLLAFLTGTMACGQAGAVLISQQTPAWAEGRPAYAFDFEQKKTYGPIGLWYGSSNSIPKCFPTLFCYAGSSQGAQLLYVKWKDGVVRPAGKSGDSNVVRFSDYGLWNEGGPGTGINYALQSRNFTNASWTLTSITATTTGIVGADGTTGSASRLTATGANGTALQSITQPGALYAANTSATQGVAAGGTGYTVNDVLTLSGATCTTTPQLKATAVSGGVITAATVQTVGSCSILPSSPVSVTGGTGTGATFNPVFKKVTASAWMKRVTGSGPVYITADNTTFTDISSSLSNSKFVQVAAPTVNQLNNTFGVKIGTSGDVVDVDFFQLETDDQPTAPILTTTTSIGRGPENVFIGTPGAQYNNGTQLLNTTQALTPFSYLMVFSSNFSTVFSSAGLLTDTPISLTIDKVTKQVLFSITGKGSITSSNAVTVGLGTINKLVVSVGGLGTKLCLNGVLTTSSTPVYATSMGGGTHMNLGNNGSNLYPSNGYWTKFIAWRRELSEAECIRYSTVVNNQ